MESPIIIASVAAALVILAAIIVYIHLCLQAKSQRQTTKRDPLHALPLDRFQIEMRIRVYYDEESVFSGQYAMTKIDNITCISVQPDTFTLCVEYQFAGQYNGRDQRAFVFQQISGKWLIAQMGENHSC